MARGGAHAARVRRPGGADARSRRDRRRRDRRRRLHRDVDGVVPEGARPVPRRGPRRARHLRRRTERTQRRVRERPLRRGRPVDRATRGAWPANRRDGGAVDRRDRRVVPGRRRRRLVHVGRRPRRVDEPGARRRRPGDRRRGRTPRVRPDLPTARRRRGARTLRLAGRANGLPRHARRDRAARAAGTRPPTCAHRARRPDLRTDPGPPIRPAAPGGRDAARDGARRSGDPRAQRVGADLA